MELIGAHFSSKRGFMNANRSETKRLAEASARVAATIAEIIDAKPSCDGVPPPLPEDLAGSLKTQLAGQTGKYHNSQRKMAVGDRRSIRLAKGKRKLTA
jgi:hypothetical protein